MRDHQVARNQIHLAAEEKFKKKEEKLKQKRLVCKQLRKYIIE